MQITRRNIHGNRQCKACKYSVLSYGRVYCERLNEYINNLVYCPYLEARPPVSLQTPV
ncbi:MAG: hypothetical protein WC325_02705 [Candidatus Bathyarchaeia archaeon]